MARAIENSATLSDRQLDFAMSVADRLDKWGKWMFFSDKQRAFARTIEARLDAADEQP